MSCVKQKDCYCGLATIRGNFVYYEEPKEIIYCGYEKMVNAVIIQDVTEIPFYIVDAIPNKFQIKDTVYVMACLDEVIKKGPCLAFGEGRIFKLKCIEKHKL